MKLKFLLLISLFIVNLNSQRINIDFARLPSIIEDVYEDLDVSGSSCMPYFITTKDLKKSLFLATMHKIEKKFYIWPLQRNELENLIKKHINHLIK